MRRALCRTSYKLLVSYISTRLQDASYSEKNGDKTVAGGGAPLFPSFLLLEEIFTLLKCLPQTSTQNITKHGSMQVDGASIVRRTTCLRVHDAHLSSTRPHHISTPKTSSARGTPLFCFRDSPKPRRGWGRRGDGGMGEEAQVSKEEKRKMQEKQKKESKGALEQNISVGVVKTQASGAR